MIFRTGCWGTVFVVVAIIGCDPSPPEIVSKDETTGYESSHGHAAHRPANFRAAIEQLALRGLALRSDAAPDRETPFATRLQQLKDIIHWLPELAGDSDLRRNDWEQVQQRTKQLEELVDRWTDPKVVHSGQTEYDRLVAELGPLAEKSVDPAPGT